MNIIPGYAAPASLVITPASITLSPGQTQQFSVQANSSRIAGIVWSVSPSGAGTISQAGLYTAPAAVISQGTVVLTATSKADPSISASADVTIVPSISIKISPDAATLYGDWTQQFTVAMENASNNSVAWSLSPAGAGTITESGLYTPSAPAPAQQTVIVTATSQEDTTKSASAVLTLMPSLLNPTLTLIAAATPPYVVGTTQQFLAELKDQDGKSIFGIPVKFTVTGANAGSTDSQTDDTGSASYSYTGKSGTDQIAVSADLGGSALTSNGITAVWLTPLESISTTTVTGQFYLSDQSDTSGIFDTPASASPAFVQQFPSINFNPPQRAIPGDTSGVSPASRPLVDVTTDIYGKYNGTIVAQGNGYQAGVGRMESFQAVFRGSFLVSRAGSVTFDLYSDDGFIFGIGNGATRIGGVSVNMPSSTVFGDYPVMGAYNLDSPASPRQIVAYFPSAGTYPYEIDYTECCGGALSLTMTQGVSSPASIAPTGSISLIPGNLNPLPKKGQQLFTVLVVDAAGNPVTNQDVSLLVTGVDEMQLVAKTDSAGRADFEYDDVNPGIAYVQGSASISGMIAYSNVVEVPWTLPSATLLPSTTGR